MKLTMQEPDATMQAPLRGYEQLLTEEQVIEALGLGDRPNPMGALRWLVRMRRIGIVKIGRGIMRFRPRDVEEFIRRSYEAADRT